MTLDQMRIKLRTMKIKPISEATGLHKNTIRAVMQDGSNPTISTFCKLKDYLEDLELKIKKG